MYIYSYRMCRHDVWGSYIPASFNCIMYKEVYKNFKKLVCTKLSGNSHKIRIEYVNKCMHQLHNFGVDNNLFVFRCLRHNSNTRKIFIETAPRMIRLFIRVRKNTLYLHIYYYCRNSYVTTKWKTTFFLFSLYLKKILIKIKCK